VCGMRLACNSVWRDADGDEVERPHYFDVNAYGGAGESVAQFMRKGRRIAVDGRLEWREWETAEKEKRQAVSVVADKVLFLDGPAGEDSEELAGVEAGAAGSLAL